jgi:membrane protein
LYGAFGVPVALLLWISFVTRLVLFCAAWTATAKAPDEEVVEVLVVQHSGDTPPPAAADTAP